MEVHVFSPSLDRQTQESWAWIHHPVIMLRQVLQPFILLLLWILVPVIQLRAKVREIALDFPRFNCSQYCSHPCNIIAAGCNFMKRSSSLTVFLKGVGAVIE